jgi:hypothetical protein
VAPHDYGGLMGNITDVTQALESEAIVPNNNPVVIGGGLNGFYNPM